MKKMKRVENEKDPDPMFITPLKKWTELIG